MGLGVLLMIQTQVIRLLGLLKMDTFFGHVCKDETEMLMKQTYQSFVLVHWCMI